MNLDYSISSEPPLVLIRTAGKFDLLQTYEMWKAIVASCRASSCTRILGISNLQAPMPLPDAYDSFSIFESVGITEEYRIAWVAGNPLVLDKLRVVEAVLRDRGYVNHRVFESVGNARDWLLQTD